MALVEENRVGWGSEDEGDGEKYTEQYFVEDLCGFWMKLGVIWSLPSLKYVVRYCDALTH